MIKKFKIFFLADDYDFLPDKDTEFDYSSDDSTVTDCKCHSDLHLNKMELVYIIIGFSVIIVVQGISVF